MRNYTTIFLILAILFLTQSVQSQITLESEDSFNGIAGADDIYNDVVIDNSGNIYSCGVSSDGITYYAFIAKHNSSGQRLWLKTFREVDNGRDNFISLGLDNSGNVYVGGNSWGSLTNSNIIVAKYDTDGNMLWRSIYNGTQSHIDAITKIVVDNSGNVYAAGNTMNGSGTDITVLKYTSSGSLQWSRIYNNPNNFDDGVNDITLDISGNVYVCGYTSIAQYNPVSIIIKYQPNGDLGLMTVSPGTTETGKTAYAIKVDSSFNIYIANESYVLDERSFLIEKINQSGGSLWKRFFTFPDTYYLAPDVLEIDEKGNIFVSGIGQTIVTDGPNYFDGYIVLKYTSDGDSLWSSLISRNYSTLGDKSKLHIYNSDNIYFSGLIYTQSSYIDIMLVKFDSAGDTLWRRSVSSQGKGGDNVNAIACDESGSVYLAGESYEGIERYNTALVKFTSSGNFEWNQQFNSEGFSSETGGMVLEDSQGNFYVTGTNSEQDILIKYDELLNRTWVYSPGKNDTDRFSSSPLIALDNEDEVYFITHRKTPETDVDVVINKLGGNSNILWTKIIQTGSNNNDRVKSVTTDESGNLYVVGTGFNSGSGSKSFVAKYSPEGQELWTNLINDSYYYQKVIVKDNFLYAIQENFVEKYDLNGILQWRREYRPNNYVNFFRDLAVDSDGNVIACGGGVIPEEDQNYIIVKYNSQGDSVWVRKYNGPVNRDDEAYSIGVDSLNNIYVTGESSQTNFTRSIITLKYDKNGNNLWVRNLRTSTTTSLPPGRLKIDQYDNVYVSSEYAFSGGVGYGYLITRYRSNGDSVWSAVYDNGQIRNFSSDFLISSAHDVIVTGRAYGINTSYDLTTIRYSQLVNIQNISSNVPDKYELYQNYPNPFNPETKIRFSIPRENFVRIKVYDILGREVGNLLDQKMTPGTYEINFNASALSSGVYFYRIETAGFSDVKRMMIVK